MTKTADLLAEAGRVRAIGVLSGSSEGFLLVICSLVATAQIVSLLGFGGNNNAVVPADGLYDIIVRFTIHLEVRLAWLCCWSTSVAPKRSSEII